MKNGHDRPSIDGFSLKRREPTGNQFGPTKKPTNIAQALRTPTEHAAVTQTAAPSILPRPQAVGGAGLRRSDIDESLKAVEDEPAKKPKKRRLRSKKWLVSFAIFAIIFGGIGYFATKFALAGGRVFSGSVFDLLGTGTKLQQDASGRTSILVFGTSEDDPGHDGAELTDSVMVVSLDQAKKTVGMVSMPRDLWVEYDTRCWVGDSGKINATYVCAAGEEKDETKGANALRKKVGEVFGLDVQYYVKVNYTVVRELTTALGGVTVTIDSKDPRGIYDYNTKIKLPNGPATLQGEQALAFVRARGDGGGYGFEGSNFAREQNQQKMLVAIRDKALSAGTLTNPAALNGLIDALGNNVRTNFSAGEIKTLATLAKDVKEPDIRHISLVDAKHPVVTSGTYNGQSIVQPSAGMNNYNGIQAYIRQQLTGEGDVQTENATIQILNGSGKVGAAGSKQTELTQAGLLNITVGNTAYRGPTVVEWYDLSKGESPKTLEKLKTVLGVSPQAGTTLPAGVQSTSDFVIILGNGTN